jgi:integrase/recombinase XerC
MTDVINTFKLHLEVKKLSPNTVEGYIFDITQLLKFEDFFSRYQNLNLNDFRRFLASRKEEGIKASSNARMVSAIKSFYTMLTKYQICKNQDFAKLTPPKLPKTLPKPLTQEEVLEMLDLNDEETFEGKRNKALLTLIYSSGMRISEALSLNKKDFNKNANFIKVLGKGGKERTLPLLSKTKEVMEEYIKACEIALLPDYPLFIEAKREKATYKPIRLSPRKVQKIMQNQRSLKGLPSFATPHSLRHSFATHIINNGGDLRSMQELLGHASLSTTQKYVKIDVKTLENAYLKFHPTSSQKN